MNLVLNIVIAWKVISGQDRYLSFYLKTNSDEKLTTLTNKEELQPYENN